MIVGENLTARGVDDASTRGFRRGVVVEGRDDRDHPDLLCSGRGRRVDRGPPQPRPAGPVAVSETVAVGVAVTVAITQASRARARAIQALDRRGVLGVVKSGEHRSDADAAGSDPQSDRGNPADEEPAVLAWRTRWRHRLSTERGVALGGWPHRRNHGSRGRKVRGCDVRRCNGGGRLSRFATSDVRGVSGDIRSFWNLGLVLAHDHSSTPKPRNSL